MKWQDVESSDEAYDWTAIGDLLRRLDNAGMTAILRIDMIGGGTTGVAYPPDGSATPGLATPPWLFYGSYYVGGEALDDPVDSDHAYIPMLPWYGDAYYQYQVQEFAVSLRDFLESNDPNSPDPNHPLKFGDAVEFIRMGGYQANSNEPNFYSDYMQDGEFAKKLRTDLENKGIAFNFDGTPLLMADGPYGVAITTIMGSWYDVFIEYGPPLATTFNFTSYPCTSDAALIDWALGSNIILLNPGLNDGDKSRSRALFAEWTQTPGQKVGWGGITHLDMGSPTARLAAAFEAFGVAEDDIPPGSCIFLDGDWSTLIRDYLPVAHVSYVVFGTNILDDSVSAYNCAVELIQSFAE